MYKEYTVDVQDDSKVTHFYRSDKLPFNWRVMSYLAWWDSPWIQNRWGDGRQQEQVLGEYSSYVFQRLFI
jgi:hypothetical protein